MKNKFDLQKIIERYEAGESIIKMAEEVKLSEAALRNRLRKIGFSVRSRSDTVRLIKGYTLDRGAFSKIETEQDHYLLGYFLADGCITGNRIHLCIGSKDIEILEYFKKYFGVNYGLTTRKVFDKRTGKFYDRATLSLSDDQIKSNLNSLNIFSNKSAVEVVPPIDTNNRHFWRGVVDGDGYVKVDKKNPSALVLVGSLDIVTSFISFCENKVGLKTKRKPVGTFYKTRELFKVQLTGDDARNVAKYLYFDANYYLTRKYKQIENL